MGTCIVHIFQYISNKMQRYTVYLYMETALHVSGGTSVTPLLLPAAIAAGSSNGDKYQML
jgi:hypothetical protein